MQQFIYQIYQFIYDILEYLRLIIPNQNVSIFRGSNARDVYINFLQKNVFVDSSLIGVNITWVELLLFLGTMILIILFIVLFVKFIIKILGIFRTRFND